MLEQSGNSGSATGVALSQMQLALEGQNEEAFNQISASLLEESGISPADLKNDIKTFQKTVGEVVQNAQSSLSDQDVTGIVNIV